MEEYIVIRFQKEKYAISISNIHEIIEMQTLTEVPRSHYFLEGVINLRGKIVPVASLAKRLNVAASEVTKHMRIIVVNFGSDVVGLIVDAVEQVVTFGEFSEPPASDVFSKVGISEHLVIPIFDISKLLDVGGETRARQQ